MALVKPPELTNKNNDSHIFINDENSDFVVCKSPDKLNALISKLNLGNTVFFVSDGDWSMHDLVMQLIKKYNPAELYITTYALREFAVRQLVLAQQRNEITAIYMLLDHRATVRTPEVYQMANMNFNKIYLTAIHAKVTVIKSSIGYITIVGSANYTSNPKIESGVISLNEQLANWYIDTIKQIMNEAEIFK